MPDKKIILNFEVERGDPIDQYYFSARMKLTNESKNLLREKLGDSIEFNDLDNYFDLDHKNFYIRHNKYADRDEMYVKDNDGKDLTPNFSLKHKEFSVELDGSEIGDYGFYSLSTIYSSNHYHGTKEKVYDDHGKLRSNTVEILDNLLSNTSNLTAQEIFSHLQNEIAEQEMRATREKRQSEEELNRKNEALKELIDKGEITLFKVIRGENIDGKRSAAVLQLDGKEITLDSDRFYIAKYENDELLYCTQLQGSMLLGYKDLFFVLNKSTYPDLESGFYSIPDHNSYGRFLRARNQDFSDNKLSEELLERDDISLLNVNEEQARSKRTANMLDITEKNVNEVDEFGVVGLHKLVQDVDARNKNGQTLHDVEPESIEAVNKEQAGSEGNILNFIKNIVSSFFSGMYNWWTDNEAEIRIDQPIDAEFSHGDQDTNLKVEESYNQNDYDLI